MVYRGFWFNFLFSYDMVRYDMILFAGFTRKEKNTKIWLLLTNFEQLVWETRISIFNQSGDYYFWWINVSYHFHGIFIGFINVFPVYHEILKAV